MCLKKWEQKLFSIIFTKQKAFGKYFLKIFLEKENMRREKIIKENECDEYES